VDSTDAGVNYILKVQFDDAGGNTQTFPSTAFSLDADTAYNFAGDPTNGGAWCVVP